MSTINNTTQPRYLQASFVESQMSKLQDGSKTISQVCIALHVTQHVTACAWVDARNLVVDFYVQSVAQCTEAFWVWSDLVTEHVSKKWQRCAVSSLGVG